MYPALVNINEKKKRVLIVASVLTINKCLSWKTCPPSKMEQPFIIYLFMYLSELADEVRTNCKLLKLH